MTRNAVYVSFILYLIGTGKLRDEWVLCSYYMMGISQNLLIFVMKKYYERQPQTLENPVEERAVTVTTTESEK